jgi:hypothetical protein
MITGRDAMLRVSGARSSPLVIARNEAISTHANQYAEFYYLAVIIQPAK